MQYVYTWTVRHSESRTGVNALQFLFIERLPKSLCGLSIEPTVFLRISIFCTLYSIWDPRFDFNFGSIASKSPSHGNIVCDLLVALDPSPSEITDTTSGVGCMLNSMPPLNDDALPFNGFAKRRKFSSFWMLFDFSSSCRAISMFGDRLTPEPVASNIRRRQNSAPSAPRINAAKAVAHTITSRNPDRPSSFVTSAVSTYKKIVIYLWWNKIDLINLWWWFNYLNFQNCSQRSGFDFICWIRCAQWTSARQQFTEDCHCLCNILRILCCCWLKIEWKYVVNLKIGQK